MSSALITIVGDENVTRNMTGLNMASRESMKSAQVISYLNTTPLSQPLLEVRSESSICIFAAMTDALLSNGDCGTIYASVDPVLTSIFTSLSGFCTAHPGLQVRIHLGFLLVFSSDKFLLSVMLIKLFFQIKLLTPM